MPLRPQCRSAYGSSKGSAFVEARRRAEANGAILLAMGEDVMPRDEPHDGCIGVLESLLGMIEQEFKDVGLPTVDGHYYGYHQQRPKDTVMPRRSKVNKRHDLDARSKLRVAVHNDGPDAFAARIPDDIVDRLTVLDDEGDAHRLLDAICDERPALKWMRAEALVNLRNQRVAYRYSGPEGTIKWKPAGRSLGWNTEQTAKVYFNIVAGRLVAEGYEPSRLRVRSKLSPGIAVSIADRAPPIAVEPPAPREVIPGHGEAYFDRLLDELLLAGRRVIIDSESDMHTDEVLLAPKPPIERGAVSAVVNLRGLEIGLLRREREAAPRPETDESAPVHERKDRTARQSEDLPRENDLDVWSVKIPGRKLDQQEIMAAAVGRGMIPRFLCGINVSRALTPVSPYPRRPLLLVGGGL
jgi:hypothetical protein